MHLALKERLYHTVLPAISGFEELQILTFRFGIMRKPEDYGHSFSKWSYFTRVAESKRDGDASAS